MREERVSRREYAMKFEIILLTVCIVIWADASRFAREAEEAKECCYPRPPPRQDRGFKKHASRCCEFPVADLWQKFDEDLESCKEAKRKEYESTSTTTTPAPAEKENETDNEFDADLPESSMESEKEEATSTTATPNEQRGHDHHKGRGKGGKHRGGSGRGKCMKETMEKHGWSNNGTIQWEAILAASEKASNPTAEEWVPIVREAITNCSKQVEQTPAEEPEKGKGHGRHHCPHHQMTPEKKAWRCVINNSIMKCPNFPEDNEYCVSLRKAHTECLATQSGYGPAQFKWCGESRKHHHGKRQ